MGKNGKNYRATVEKVDNNRRYSLDEALDLLSGITYAKFDESVDLAVRLGVDPRHADQMVRGSAVLPHGTGKTVRVLAFTKGEKALEAQEAGADYVGLDEYIEKIRDQGWLEFEKVVATPDVMGQVGKLGKILGTRGLMPSPKTGTVTFEVTKAIKDIKAGKVDFKVDKVGNVHASVGKRSFGKEKLSENILALMDIIIRAKPSSAKGVYMRNISVSSTMSAGIKVDPTNIQALVKA